MCIEGGRGRQYCGSRAMLESNFVKKEARIGGVEGTGENKKQKGWNLNFDITVVDTTATATAHLLL
jgi:hypothetical protein